MKKYENIISAIKSYTAFIGEILENEPMAPKTTFRVGGTAELFIKPQNYYSFQIVLNVLLENNVRFFILGGGSNVVFPDETFEGVVISTQSFSDVDFFTVTDTPKEFGPVSLKKNQTLITCFSGTPMAAFVNFCTENGLTGAEEFAGLPGTVGGATFMNARCFNKSISDLIFYVSYMDYSTNSVQLKRSLFNASEWDYKQSPFQNKPYFITTVTFLLTKATSEEKTQIPVNCKKYINERISKGHFKYPSAGSVFKNNHDFGKPSGQLIDECGLKGLECGGAQIAPFHGNFIINVNKATASDIKNLVKAAQNAVKEKFNFNLEPEIIFI